MIDHKNMRRVVIESPFSGKTPKIEQENIRYARLCVHDCLARGEAPYASHLFFTQPDVLDDDVPKERELGIAAGFAWGETAELVAVYTDRGISKGMEYGIERARKAGQTIENRTLPGYLSRCPVE